MAKLILKFNAAVIKEFDVTQDVLTFGRKPDNDLVIDHPTVSGHHGKFIKEGANLIVEDLNSTNGTFINGRKIHRYTLKNQDQIVVSKHVLEFIDETAAQAASPRTAPTPEKTPAPATTTTPSSSPPLEVKEEIRQHLGIPPGGVPPAKAAPSPNPSPAQAQPPSPPQPGPPSTGKAHVKIIAGGVEGQKEVRLTERVTYIGSSDQAAIKISGFLAPSLAAAISLRAEGFFLKAVKPGYPKVNGIAVNEQVLLDNGAMIEVGGTNMAFYASDEKNKPA